MLATAANQVLAQDDASPLLIALSLLLIAAACGGFFWTARIATRELRKARRSHIRLRQERRKTRAAKATPKPQPSPGEMMAKMLGSAVSAAQAIRQWLTLTVHLVRRMEDTGPDHDDDACQAELIELIRRVQGNRGDNAVIQPRQLVEAGVRHAADRLNVTV